MRLNAQTPPNVTKWQHKCECTPHKQFLPHTLTMSSVCNNMIQPTFNSVFLCPFMRQRDPDICVRHMYFFNFGCQGLATSCVEIALNISAYIVVSIFRVKEGGGECSCDIKSATKFAGQECTLLV